MIFKIVDLIRDNNYSRAGTEIYKYGVTALLDNEIITIDMEGVESVPTTFMNTSFGALMDMHGVEKVKKSFRFRNILKSQFSRFKTYFTDYDNLFTDLPMKYELLKLRNNKFKFILKDGEGLVLFESREFEFKEEFIEELEKVKKEYSAKRI